MFIVKSYRNELILFRGKKRWIKVPRKEDLGTGQAIPRKESKANKEVIREEHPET